MKRKGRKHQMERWSVGALERETLRPFADVWVMEIQIIANLFGHLPRLC